MTYVPYKLISPITPIETEILPIKWEHLAEKRREAGALIDIEEDICYIDPVTPYGEMDIDRIVMSLGSTKDDTYHDVEMLMVLTSAGIGWLPNRRLWKRSSSKRR